LGQLTTGHATDDAEDYFDRIVGEIEDVIIDEQFLELQSGMEEAFGVTTTLPCSLAKEQ
jgi:hypothetical protein